MGQCSFFKALGCFKPNDVFEASAKKKTRQKVICERNDGGCIIHMSKLSETRQAARDCGQFYCFIFSKGGCLYNIYTMLFTLTKAGEYSIPKTL